MIDVKQFYEGRPLVSKCFEETFKENFQDLYKPRYYVNSLLMYTLNLNPCIVFDLTAIFICNLHKRYFQNLKYSLARLVRLKYE